MPAPRTVENQKLRQLIWKEYIHSEKRLSAASMHIVFSRDYGTTVRSGRVYRLMNSMDLPKISTVKPKFRYHKPAVSFDYPNILNQQFDPNEPNRAWVSNITYNPVKNKFVYLCVILDLFSRKVIAWKLSHRMTASLVIDTLGNALIQRQPNEPVLFYSDRGTQYTSVGFRQFLDTHNPVASYSKPRYPYDNAVIDSFFKYLKRDELNRRNFNSLEEVSLATFSYIEGWYNNRRPHSHNKMLTPNEKEEHF